MHLLPSLNILFDSWESCLIMLHVTETLQNSKNAFHIPNVCFSPALNFNMLSICTSILHQLDFHLLLFTRSSYSFWPEIQITFILGTYSKRSPFLKWIRKKKKKGREGRKKIGIEICRKITSFTLNIACWKSYRCDLPRLIIPFGEEYSRPNI